MYPTLNSRQEICRGQYEDVGAFRDRRLGVGERNARWRRSPSGTTGGESGCRPLMAAFVWGVIFVWGLPDCSLPLLRVLFLYCVWLGSEWCGDVPVRLIHLRKVCMYALHNHFQVVLFNFASRHSSFNLCEHSLMLSHVTMPLPCSAIHGFNTSEAGSCERGSSSATSREAVPKVLCNNGHKERQCLKGHADYIWCVPQAQRFLGNSIRDTFVTGGHENQARFFTSRDSTLGSVTLR